VRQGSVELKPMATKDKSKLAISIDMSIKKYILVPFPQASIFDGSLLTPVHYL
jgi:hypothetical protein